MKTQTEIEKALARLSKTLKSKIEKKNCDILIKQLGEDNFIKFCHWTVRDLFFLPPESCFEERSAMVNAVRSNPNCVILTYNILHWDLNLGLEQLKWKLSLLNNIPLWLKVFPSITYLSILFFIEFQSPVLGHLCKALQTNQTITHLDFVSEDSIRTTVWTETGRDRIFPQIHPLTKEDFKSICDCLLINKKIKCVVLPGLNMADDDSELLSQVIEKNSTLTEFYCGQGTISATGACLIYRALAKNKNLKLFSMQGLEIKGIETFDQEVFVANEVVKLIQNNQTLQTLDLCKPTGALGFTTCIIVLRALKNNETLKSLSGWSGLLRHQHYFTLFKDELSKILAYSRAKYIGLPLNYQTELWKLGPFRGFQMRSYLRDRSDKRSLEIRRIEGCDSLRAVDDKVLKIIMSYDWDLENYREIEIQYQVKDSGPSSASIAPLNEDENTKFCLFLFPEHAAKMRNNQTKKEVEQRDEESDTQENILGKESLQPHHSTLK